MQQIYDSNVSNDMEDELIESKKKWLFKEQLRLEELKNKLEDEKKLIDIQKELLKKQNIKVQLMRKQLEGQKSLFESQWAILERETRRLADDQQRFDQERRMYTDKVYGEARKSVPNAQNVRLFFIGVENMESLKQRYKALLKIYHPDNLYGDKEIQQAISEEYERLSRFYIGS